MRWGDPAQFIWLWALIPLMVICYLGAKASQRKLALLAEEEAWDKIGVKRRKSSRQWRSALWFLALGLLLLSFARPQWGFSWQEITRKGMDIMVVLDTSNSMLAEDIKPNRLDRARYGIKDLVKLLNGDRVGLVAFAGSSFLQCPLTIDYAAFLMTLDDVYAGIIPRGGTEIDQALETAIANFSASAKGDKAIVLITDGESHAVNDGKIIQKLKEMNIKVFSLGVGTLEGELIPVVNNSNTSFLKDRSGKVVKSSLNENYLEQLALSTGGIYVRSVGGDFGLEQIYNRGLSTLKRDEQDARMEKLYEERYNWLVALALGLLLIEAGIKEKKAS